MSDPSDQDCVASPVSGVWRCSCCGEVVEATDSRARWAGDHWQHACGDPHAGHHPCRFFRAADPRDAELARLRRELEAKLGESGRLAEENTRMRDGLWRVIRFMDSYERSVLDSVGWKERFGDEISAAMRAVQRAKASDPGPDGEGSDTD